MIRPDLPARLPLFAFPGAVLLPRGRAPITVFEPRYLQLVEDVLKTPDRLIGLIQPQGEGYARVGSAGRLVGFQEMDDGRLLISLKAVSRFVLTEDEEGLTPYPRGRVDWGGFAQDRGDTPQEDAGFDREQFLRRLRRYMAARELATDWEMLDEAGDEMLINALAMALPLEPEEKQALLEAPTLSARRELLDGLLEFALHQGGNDTSEALQ